MKDYKMVLIGIFIMLILILRGCHLQRSSKFEETNLFEVAGRYNSVGYFKVDGMTCIKWSEYESGIGYRAITCNWDEWEGSSEELGE